MGIPVIIPVFNEGERVYGSIYAALKFPSTEEVIVVDDGSSFPTRELLAGIDGITLLTHSRNRGKGAALNTGVAYARKQGFDCAVFLDGDLIGIEPYHIKELLDPIESDALMSIGYLGLRKEWAKNIYKNWGALCGQRAIRLEIWNLISERDKHGFNIEAALNARTRKKKIDGRIVKVALAGVSHVGKREKEGNWPAAVLAYVKTYGAAVLTYARIEIESLASKLRSLDIKKYRNRLS